MKWILRQCLLFSTLMAVCKPYLCKSQSLIEPTKSQVVGGTAGGGLIVGQSRCDASGNLYFRQLQNTKAVVPPVVQISADGSRSHTFDILAQPGKDLKSFRVNDFAISGSTLYLAGTAEDAKVHVLEYSTKEGEQTGSLILDDTQAPRNVSQGTLTVSKINVMFSGELLVFGVRTVKEDLPNTAVPRFSYNPALELYDRSGRFIKAINFKSDQVVLNNKTHPPENNFAAVDLALSANGPDGVYLVVHSNETVMYVISPDGEISRKLPLESIGNEYRPIGLSISGSQMLLEFVKSTDGSPETTFVAYNANSGDKVSVYKLSDSLNGIFSCYDGRRTFTFLSTDALGQRTIAFADARQ